MVHNTPTKHNNPSNTPSQPHHQPQPQPQRFRPFDYLREPPTAPRLHRPPDIGPPSGTRSLANSAPGSLPFAPFTPAMTHLKYPPSQILFIKNVPAEYATHVTTLFRAFQPLEMKNLYPFSTITTLMVALPSAEAAEEALQRTDEMKVGTALVSVERFSAKQSVVVRREARRGRGEGFVGGGLGVVVEGKENEEHEDEDDKMHWPVLGEGKEVDGEVGKPVPRKMAARKGEKGKGKSWANIAAGVKAAEGSSSSRSSVPLLTPSNGSESLDAKLSPSDDEQGEAHSSTEDPGPDIHVYLGGSYNPPPIGSAIPRPTVKPGFWLPPISGLALSPPTAATPTASKLPLPTWSRHLPSPGLRPPPGFPQLPAHSGAPAWSMFSGRTEGLNMPVDTTTYIRERHCAGCSLCNLLKSRKIWE